MFAELFFFPDFQWLIKQRNVFIIHVLQLVDRTLISKRLVLFFVFLRNKEKTRFSEKKKNIKSNIDF